jgi:hypothetical protein
MRNEHNHDKRVNTRRLHRLHRQQGINTCRRKGRLEAMHYMSISHLLLHHRYIITKVYIKVVFINKTTFVS